MSQKNETAILALALLLTVGIVGGGAWLFTNGGVKISNTLIPGSEAGNNPSLSLQDRISFGDKILIPGAVSAAKKEGVEAIAAKSYDQAIANFTDSLKLNRNDPEALIFLNNARIGSSKSYTIVASVAIGTDPNASLEILRGIAQAQNEINTSGGAKGVRLRVGIANDDDNPEISKQIAFDYGIKTQSHTFWSSTSPGIFWLFCHRRFWYNSVFNIRRASQGEELR